MEGLSVKSFAKMIDHTMLKPDATLSDLERAIEEYKRFGFACLALSPYHAKIAATRFRGVRVCTVIAFPMGFSSARANEVLARELLEAGVAELDVVINIHALKAGDREAVVEDLRAVVEVAKGYGAVVKGIIETGLLTDEEKAVASQLVVEAGAHFVKTCTGFLGGKATIHDVALIKRVVGDKAKIKASGGIRHAEDALALIAAGASRIGTSAGPRIVEEFMELKRVSGARGSSSPGSALLNLITQPQQTAGSYPHNHT